MGDKKESGIGLKEKKMRWIYELSWLWKSVGIILLIVAICECCAVWAFKGMKKHYGVKAAICVAVAAAVLSAICILLLARIPMPL